MQTKILTASLLAVLTIGILVAPSTYVYAQSGGWDYGRTSGVAAALVTKTIEPTNAKVLAFNLAASGGNFGSATLTVSVSVDGTNFVSVDTVALGTNTTMTKYYDDDHLATTKAVNPALFPFVKIATSAGNSGVTETITWVVSR